MGTIDKIEEAITNRTWNRKTEGAERGSQFPKLAIFPLNLAKKESESHGDWKGNAISAKNRNREAFAINFTEMVEQSRKRINNCLIVFFHCSSVADGYWRLLDRQKDSSSDSKARVNQIKAQIEPRGGNYRYLNCFWVSSNSNRRLRSTAVRKTYRILIGMLLSAHSGSKLDKSQKMMFGNSFTDHSPCIDEHSDFLHLVKSISWD